MKLLKKSFPLPPHHCLELQILTDFYPKHIEKEDKVFFPSSRNYYKDKDDQAMLAEFWEFDRKMIHEKYKSLVEGFESRQ